MPPVSFPAWKEALSAPQFSTAIQAGYRREILAFLPHCKIEQAPATVILAKEYLAAKERQGATGWDVPARLMQTVPCRPSRSSFAPSVHHKKGVTFGHT